MVNRIKLTKSGGFTIVEVLITLTILTLVLSLSYQSLSIFLNAASKNRSQFEKVQNETMLRLQLRSSVRSMLDYYIVNQQGKRVPLFYSSDSLLQYVSLSPMVYERGEEVLVTWRIEQQQASPRLIVTECRLKNAMPYKLEQFPYQLSEDCMQVSQAKATKGLSFKVDSLNSDSASAANNPFMNLPGFAQSQDTAQATTKHLLPSSITIMFETDEGDYSWVLYPKIENLIKYFTMDGYQSNV